MKIAPLKNRDRGRILIFSVVTSVFVGVTAESLVMVLTWSLALGYFSTIGICKEGMCWPEPCYRWPAGELQLGFTWAASPCSTVWWYCPIVSDYGRIIKNCIWIFGGASNLSNCSLSSIQFFVCHPYCCTLEPFLFRLSQSGLSIIFRRGLRPIQCVSLILYLMLLKLQSSLLVSKSKS